MGRGSVRRGEALLELALALPVLALMFWGILGLMERGRTANLAVWAAYACAAQASQTPDGAQGLRQGEAAARAVLGRRLVDVTVGSAGSSRNCGGISPMSTTAAAACAPPPGACCSPSPSWPPSTCSPSGWASRPPSPASGPPPPCRP